MTHPENDRALKACISRKEVFVWWLVYIFVSPIALDFMSGVYHGLGILK